MIPIVTERLRLRPFEVDDLPTFVAYRRDHQVARYQSWETTYSMGDAARLLASQPDDPLGQSGEWLQLAAVDRETGVLLGDCALRVTTDQPATAEIGVTFAAGSQGRGLASEALEALVTIRLFERHGMIECSPRPVAMPGGAPRPRAAGFPLRGASARGRLVQRRMVDAGGIYAVLEREWTQVRQRD